jgi:nucleotide-binding universal stress UspA family protein
MRRNVTVGVDGSAAGGAAAEWAAREAARRGVALRLLHAQPPLPGRTTVTTPTDPAPRPRTSARAAMETEARLRAEYEDLPVVADEVAARPADALLAAASQADLLVVGTRGEGALAGTLLGSVGRAVAGHAPCPVVLVPAEAGEPTDGDEDDAGSVVLGLDVARPADPAIAFAFEAADARRENLRIVHGSSADADPTAPVEAVGPDAEDAALAAELAPWQARFPAVDVIGEEAVGGVGRHLADAAEHACLVVLGHRAGHGRNPRLGPVAQQVLHGTPTPIALIPHNGPTAA